MSCDSGSCNNMPCDNTSCNNAPCDKDRRNVPFVNASCSNIPSCNIPCNIEKIKIAIEEIYDRVVEIRRQLHSQPELSGNEINTERIITDTLSSLNIEYKDHIAGHGVVALIPGKDTEKAIALRADIDALPIQECTDAPYRSTTPGVMHACGHDMHTAILLGTAMVLKSLEATLPLCVKFFFQPAEETTGGALPMINEGCMKLPEVTAVIGLHVKPELDVGTVEFFESKMNAASTEFTIITHGKPSHGAYPHQGIDPILIAAQIAVSLQSIVSRRLPAAEPAVISIGSITGGTASNIMPAEVKMQGIIRTLDENITEKIKSHMKQLAEGTAAAFGGRAEVHFTDSYPLLQNDSAAVKKLRQAAIQCLGAQNVLCGNTPLMGADDFAYFSKAAPGVYFNLGVHSPHPLHSPLFLPDENAIRSGILMETVGVLTLMGQYEITS